MSDRAPHLVIELDARDRDGNRPTGVDELGNLHRRATDDEHAELERIANAGASREELERVEVHPSRELAAAARAAAAGDTAALLELADRLDPPGPGEALRARESGRSAQ